MFNTVWQVAIKPGTTKMQYVILADLEINDLDTISLLLATNNLKGEAIETERGNYLLMYGGEYRRPYPSIMIWRFENIEGESVIKDMRQEDIWIIKYVWGEWLMPEDSEAEYMPRTWEILS